MLNMILTPKVQQGKKKIMEKSLLSWRGLVPNYLRSTNEEWKDGNHIN